jgi:hypothetical protein
VSSIDWVEVRRAYELSSETVASIRKRFGIGRSTLARRRVREGWATRPPVAVAPPFSGRKPVEIEAIELRLNKLVVVGMELLERRITEEGLTEVNARTLTELCRAEELRMRTTRQKTGKTRETKNHDAAHDFRDDPAWLDAELNRRMDRRFGPRGGGSGSGKDDGGRKAGGARGVEGIGKGGSTSA